MATAQERACANLAAAEEALQNLALGRGVVEVQDQNGERMRYTAARRQDLIATIEYWRPLCETTAAPMRSKPLGFVF